MSFSSHAAVAGDVRRRGGARSGAGDAAAVLWRWPVWLVVAVGIVALAAVIVLRSGMTPSFDPYGWLTWGHQLLYGDLSLNSAPSWKPLMIIFTLPFALVRSASPRLLSIAMVTGTLAMAPFAGRIAFRLLIGDRVGCERTRRVTIAAWIGALFAAAGVLGLNGADVPATVGPPQSLWHLTFIADSDPLCSAIVLAALDAHLSRRPRLAYVLLFAAGLNRPEAWSFMALYGIYLIWRVPGTRTLVIGGWVLVLVAWYLPTAVAARSVFQASTLDQGKVSAIHGEPVLPVLRRWVTFYEWPMQVAALLGLALAALRRDPRALLPAAGAAVWLIVEMLFAIHGLSAVARYMIEPAALMVVLGGYAIGQALAGAPAAGSSRVPRLALGAVGTLVAVGLVLATAFFWHKRESRVRALLLPGVRNYGVVAHHLGDAVRLAGGARAILRCGAPVALNQYQTELAWTLNLNGSQVKYNPARTLAGHQNVVVFTETGFNGWTVRAYNVPRALARGCARVSSVTVAST